MRNRRIRDRSLAPLGLRPLPTIETDNALAAPATRATRKDEDLSAAQSQSAAMAKANGSRRPAVERAPRGSVGVRAVSVVPSLEDGRTVADVTLAKGEDVRRVSVQSQ